MELQCARSPQRSFDARIKSIKKSNLGSECYRCKDIGIQGGRTRVAGGHNFGTPSAFPPTRPSKKPGRRSMTEIQFRGLRGATIAVSIEIDDAAIQVSRHRCLAEEAGYDEARTIWNAMIDRRPAAVVRCQRGKRCHGRRALCSRQRAAGRGARRWPQHRRQCGLRGWAPDRPVADALRAYRPERAPRG